MTVYLHLLFIIAFKHKDPKFINQLWYFIYYFSWQNNIVREVFILGSFCKHELTLYYFQYRCIFLQIQWLFENVELILLSWYTILIIRRLYSYRNLPLCTFIFVCLLRFFWLVEYQNKILSLKIVINSNHICLSILKEILVTQTNNTIFKLFDTSHHTSSV